MDLGGCFSPDFGVENGHVTFFLRSGFGTPSNVTPWRSFLPRL